MALRETRACPVVIRLSTPTARRGLTELTVTPGLVDDHARELFLFAQCQMLALAIHERTGWPLWVAEQQLPTGAWSWAHVGVQTPDGRWLDIEGPRDSQQVLSWLGRWGLAVRRRLLGLADWHVLLGRPADTPATWWRTQILTPESVALVETFAEMLTEISFARPAVDAVRQTLAAVDGTPTDPTTPDSLRRPS
ncbi:hypothetical protein [Streptosporangium jomthongense]|uniref:Uncharacterized protein n=1 Tax=Streptosporangium jomthongense TaxID=1193683 RepID=A0ABV8FHC1_9ACTN